MAFTLVLTKLPKSQQPVGLAIFALSVTFAPAIGPTIGGYLTENYGWRTIFFVNVIPTVVMVSALYLTLERQPMQLKLVKEGDWAGIVTMAIGLSALQTVLAALAIVFTRKAKTSGGRPRVEGPIRQ